MFPNHFFGIAEIDEEYKINIQGHSREKLIKLPIKFKDEKAVFQDLCQDPKIFRREDYLF